MRINFCKNLAVLEIARLETRKMWSPQNTMLGSNLNIKREGGQTMRIKSEKAGLLLKDCTQFKTFQKL